MSKTKYVKWDPLQILLSKLTPVSVDFARTVTLYGCETVTMLDSAWALCYSAKVRNVTQRQLCRATLSLPVAQVLLHVPPI